MDVKHFTEDMIWLAFENASQSRKNDPSFECLPHHQMSVNISIFETQKGGTAKHRNRKKGNLSAKINRLDVLNFDHFKISKTCIKSPINQDNNCLLRSILIAKFYFDFVLAFKTTKRLKSKELYAYVEKETNRVSLDLGFDGEECGIFELKLIEEYFVEYQIMLFHHNVVTHKTPIYLNNDKKFDKHLYVILDNKRHYSAVISMKAYLEKSYYCHFCKTGYNNLTDHRCVNLCFACKRYNCISTNLNETCIKCQIITKNNECHIRHVTLVCDKYKKCKKCNFKLNKNHVCDDNMKWCQGCTKVVALDHMCYLKGELENENKKINKKKDEFVGFVFFDFECMVSGPDNFHKVNLALAQKICIGCANLKAEDRCNNCQVIHKFNNIDEFCDWSLRQVNTIQIAHNLKVNY